MATALRALLVRQVSRLAIGRLALVPRAKLPLGPRTPAWEDSVTTGVTNVTVVGASISILEGDAPTLYYFYSKQDSALRKTYYLAGDPDLIS